MDNIVVKKVWEDVFGVEIHFCFITSYVEINSIINVRRNEFLNNKVKFQKCIEQGEKSVVLLFGHIGGDYSPGIEMNIHITINGHLEIEVVAELADDAVPKHRCNFSLLSEIGIFNDFIENLCDITEVPLETEYYLINSK